jgi:hypothetical protein
MCQWAKAIIESNKVQPEKKSNGIYKTDQYGNGNHYWSSAQYEHDMEKNARYVYEKSPHYRKKQKWIEQGKLF